MNKARYRTAEKILWQRIGRAPTEPFVMDAKQAAPHRPQPEPS